MIEEKSRNSRSNRIGWIDSAKGLSMFMIVLGHCADKTGDDNILLHLCMFTGVGTFFFLAGMTFCDGGSWIFDNRPWRVFLKDLLRRIIFPYFVWSAVSILVYAAFGRAAVSLIGSDRHNFGIAKNFAGMLYANSGTGYMEWNRPLWFLPCLAVVEMLWFLLLKWMALVQCRRTRRIIYGAALAVSFFWLIFMSFMGIRLVLPWELETAVCVMPYFGMGKLFRYWLKKQGRETLTAKGSAIAFTIAVVFLALDIFLLKDTAYADFRADRFSSPSLLIPDMVCGAAATLSGGIALRKFRLVKYIGRRTMAILVMHKFPVMLFKVMAEGFGVQAPFGRIGVIGGGVILGDLAMAGITVLLCLVVERLISAVFPEAYGRTR